ncbi:PTS sugar transporter subunit IIA [bacterium]|nr:MAG: PTS sugar transporter subunit IIA [bacterium]RKZ17029.1 MAG: PTS sugar transporter subunit IIA [bacterium]
MTTDELVENMNADLFVGDFKAASKSDALDSLTEAVVTGSDVNDRELVLGMLTNREQLGSTALEQGVAFPHGRSLAVKQLTILFARSKDGVDFESEDGKPTHLFFLILAPPQDTGNYYLQALGKIAELVRKDNVRQALMEVEDFDSMITLLKEAS